MGTIQPIQLLVAGPRIPETRALHQLLTQQQAIVVVGETPEISRVPMLASLCTPDVVLLHARGPEFALEAIRAILAQVPDAKLLVVVNSFSLDEAALLLERGASGVVAVVDSFAQGMRAIRAVHAGEIWGSRGVLSRIVQSWIKRTMPMHSLSKSSLNLTGRENEFVNLLRSGFYDKEIAARPQGRREGLFHRASKETPRPGGKITPRRPESSFVSWTSGQRGASSISWMRASPRRKTRAAWVRH